VCVSCVCVCVKSVWNFVLCGPSCAGYCIGCLSLGSGPGLSVIKQSGEVVYIST
jgi:hypothetical protein